MKHLLSIGLIFCMFLPLPVIAQEPVPQAASPSQSKEPVETTPTKAVEQLPVPDWDPQTVEPSRGRKDDPIRSYDPSTTLFDMLGKLLIVLGLICLLAWLAQKYLPKKLGALGESKNLKLIQSLPLGPRRFVSLIEADGRRFLIGVTETQINLIKALDELPFGQTFSQTLTATEEIKTVDELLEQEL